MKILSTLLLSILSTVQIIGQVLEVDIAPDGITVPRLLNHTTATPQEAKIVYSLSSDSYWFCDDNQWNELSTNSLCDSDGDTKIHVEKTPNDNLIRFDLNGVERMLLLENGFGQQRLEFNNNPANTFIGFGAGQITNGSAGNNTCVGDFAMWVNSSGGENTTMGVAAMLTNSTGSYNSAFGRAALNDNDTGWERTALGHHANSLGANFNNNTGLGYDTDCTASDQVRIGNAVTSIGGPQAWTNTSDQRFKKDITENKVPGLDFILKLRAVNYKFDQAAYNSFIETNYGEKKSVRSGAYASIDAQQLTGFIAQEVEATAQQLGYENFYAVDKPKNSKDFYGLRYSIFTIPIVKAIQEQQLEIGKITELELEVEKQAQEIAELKRLVEVLISKE